MTTVLHVIAQLGRGGGARSLLTSASAAATARADHAHRVISLRQSVPEMADRVTALGMTYLDAPPPEVVREELERADVVHVHFYNSPELYELLRSALPPMRMVVWPYVGGDEAPQVLLPELVELADLTVASAPYTAALPVLARAGAPTIDPVAEPVHLGRSPVRRGHEGVAVGYVGTVDPVKMHPDFVELCAAVGAPDARFVVCGLGDGFTAIARRAEELGVRERFDLRGYVTDAAAIFAELDVLGYPLRRGNYSASDFVIQEAMHAGVPPVVLPYGGAASTVTDGETGIVAPDEHAYVEAVDRLVREPELRARLSAGARAHARRRWSTAGLGAAWSAVYDELLEAPKRARSWPGTPAVSGAERFVASLGDRDAMFRASLFPGDLDEALAADADIAAAPPVVVRADGGILDYRRRYPDDPHLRLWAGLALDAEGRRVLAAGELSQAMRLGCDPRRASARLTRIVEALDERRSLATSAAPAARVS